ncbi:MAG: hypothetical protein EBR82_39385 [Caulobacteraceae bacterium]|nr:hypothetical protein [Caulobacteraceae bacterium]
MSAYLVEENHIEYLVDALTNPQNQMAGTLRHIAETTDPQKIGQILWDENARSVNHRYNETESAPPFTYRRICYATDPLQVLASIRCYIYQTRETPDFEQSKAGRLINLLQSAVISRMTAGKKWGAPEPEANQIRLSCLVKR